MIADGGVYGRVIGIGRNYANVNTDLTWKTLRSLDIRQGTRLRIRIADHEVTALLGTTYTDVPKGNWVALFDDEGNLRIAIAFGQAAHVLECNVGDMIFVERTSYNLLE